VSALTLLYESFAAACVDKALPGIAAYRHDNGRRTSAHDFDLMGGAEMVAAMEVTSATDGPARAITNEWSKGGTLTVPGLASNWMVRVRPVDPRGMRSRMACLRSRIGDILTEFKSKGIDQFHDDRYFPEPELAAKVGDLGIRQILLLGPQGAGRVHVEPWYPIERSAGFVQSDGNSLADWIGEWLSDPEQADNLTKLRSSGLAERHLFVVLPTLPMAPFEVFNVFFNETPPNHDPVLPEEVSHVWAAADSDHLGWRWSRADGWRAFAPQRGPFSTPPECSCA
jgi:hypothetical protein